jgi:hypothetical protein
MLVSAHCPYQMSNPLQERRLRLSVVTDRLLSGFNMLFLAAGGMQGE